MLPRCKNPSRDESNEDSPATARLVTRLLELIDRGDLRPGEQLPPERELAKILNISRASLRSGIVSLEVIGVLKSRHRQGTFVSPEILAPESISPQSVGGFVSSQLFEARLRLETLVTELAVHRLTPSEMSRLAEQTVEMFATLDNPSKFATHYMQFHRIIARAARNAVLYALLETITASILSGRPFSMMCAQELRESAAIHCAIYKAVRSRNPSQARSLMEKHLRTTSPLIEIVAESPFEEMAEIDGSAGALNGN
jgi:GntR family transcriptional regulator, transcriptional repressor for pyruvate dehydrogenase complex